VRRDYVEVEANGQRFRLYFDVEEPGALHIVARHGMTAADAAALFFEAKRIWNDARQRFESRQGRRVLYWAWLHGQEGGTVLVLSCFESQEKQEER
jgi:hypothetical protein